MQRAATRFTKIDLAKYPFLKETTEYVKKLDLKIDDLTKPEFERILDRAEDRVEEAILFTLVNRNLRDPEVEIFSFPAALVLVTATQNTFIQKRYALAEAKQTYEDLTEEPMERTLEIACNFGWKLVFNEDPGIPFDFTLGFTDYLTNITHLKDKKWKLVNRILSGGMVYITRNEATRLLSEEVRRHIERRLTLKELPSFPPKIQEIAEKIRELTVKKIGKTEMEGFPKVVVQTAFPPCINTLYQSFTSGRHLSHVGRFTLTTFLVNTGMPTEKIIELFRNFSDFNERMTRYQVEHIAGEKGSRTRYIPPMCDTLRTHGVCVNPDELCQSIRHPLTYYRIKLRASR
jgi:DNA primase large subunit